MHAFGILAEAKMRRWEKEKKNGKASKKSSRQFTLGKNTESLEKQLYAEVKQLIHDAEAADTETRTTLLKKAERIQIQLTTRLEKGGHYNVAKLLSENIQEIKRQYNTPKK